MFQKSMTAGPGLRFFILAYLLIGTSCMHNIDAPRAEKIAHVHSKHNHNRSDDYFWMRDRNDPKVIAHLTAENTYTEKAMAPVRQLEENIFQEMKGRTKEDESTYPYKYKDYYYYSRFEKGQQYPIYARKHGSLDAPEEILLNVNEVAIGHDFCQTTSPMISPNQQIMAYGVDFVGRRFFTLYFKDLKTGKLFESKIENVTGNMVWSSDSQHVTFSQQNQETLRSEKILRHDLKSKKTDLVYFEKDETFNVGVYKSLLRKYVYIISSSTLTTETLYQPADKPQEAFKVFLPREREHEYSVVEGDDGFYILSNKNAKNYRLLKTDFAHTDMKHWKEIIPHRADTYLNGITVFKNYVALEERRNGLTQLHVFSKDRKQDYSVDFPDQSYLASAGANAEYESEVFRYEYESMRSPETVFDFNMKTKEQVLRKVKEVPNYNADLYVAERVFITAKDGTQVPVSIVRRKDIAKNNKAPMLVYGYGSYGASMDPWFSPGIFSLVDRGFVYAVAHIRGGSEMGREWYDSGRTVNKKNTFTDFIDATEALVKLGYADSKRLYAMGGSAGGLLMGAVINMRPDLYKGIVAQVPFVDVITTMLDDSIPLTTGEYDEWGNPNDKTAYDYILSYSPYDNIEKKAYPNMLVTTGLHDSQVQYWEPAKWVARIRELKTNKSLILLKTDMSAGHGGASGRFDRLKERATEFAFILMVDEKY